MGMKIGFTGTQDGMTPAQKKTVHNLLVQLQPDEVHHGLCIGSDTDFHNISKRLRLYIVGHPGRNYKGVFPKMATGCLVDELRPVLPYLQRNLEIVRETVALIATPFEDVEQRRSGTWSTVRRARERGRTVWIIKPNGNIVID